MVGSAALDPASPKNPDRPRLGLPKPPSYFGMTREWQVWQRACRAAPRSVPPWRLGRMWVHVRGRCTALVAEQFLGKHLRSQLAPGGTVALLGGGARLAAGVPVIASQTFFRLFRFF